jgi:hypothetical protein
MPQLEIRIQRVEPLYDKYAEPTVNFLGDITNRANDMVFLAYFRCEVALKNGGIVLGTVPLAVPNLQYNLSKNFEVFFSFGVDPNNVIHDLLKQQELEDIIFAITFKGFCLYGPQGQPLNNMLEGISQTKEIGLPIDKYKRLLSTYYRDIAWISVSRETYHKLRELMNKKGATTMDELITDIMEGQARERRG